MRWHSTGVGSGEVQRGDDGGAVGAHPVPSGEELDLRGEVLGGLRGPVLLDTPTGATEVAYEVLCRQHHRRRLTAARARTVSLGVDPLPFG